MIIQAYHGTNAEFMPEDLDIRDKAYLTDNENLAATFGKNVMHLEVEAKNPYEIDWTGCSWGGGYFPADDALFEEYLEYASDGDEEEMEYWEENGMCVDMFASMLSEKGYDMLILHDVLEEHGYSDTEYVVLPGCIVRGVPEAVLDDVIKEVEGHVTSSPAGLSRDEEAR